MCVVSDTSLKKMIIPDREYGKAKQWFEKRDWNSIRGRILIQPYDSANLGPFSYDLSVGQEVFLMREQQKRTLGEKTGLTLGPNDGCLVLTREYIGLPREFAASVQPRFSFVRNGILQSMTKIDPTWYGRVAVAIVNQSGRPFQLKEAQPFCTLVLHRLDEACSKTLDSKDFPALGKESIDYFLAT